MRIIAYIRTSWPEPEVYTIALLKYIAVYASLLESWHLRDGCLCSVYLKFCTINELYTTINTSIEWTDSSWYKKEYPLFYTYIPVYTSICLYIQELWIISFHVLCISMYIPCYNPCYCLWRYKPHVKQHAIVYDFGICHELS